MGALVNEGKFRSRNLMAKNTAMEDVNGRLSISKWYFPTIGKKRKEANDYEG